MANKTMKAVVFDGPGKISVQERPVPQLRNPDDIIVKVQATALCGSELHVYRGLEKPEPGFVMGHEFSGIVVEAGSNVKTVRVGDKVVTPFTVSCMECFYCLNGFSGRCQNSLLFGSPSLDGGQAEYVRIPFADGTAVKAPPEIEDRSLILMGDIFPTGFFGAKNAFELLRPVPASEATIIVVGCGPVGLCAILSALEYRPKHVFAIDGVESRLEIARNLGAEPINFTEGKDKMLARVQQVTEGRGADAVIEVVGLSAALRTAYDLLRPFGVISSIGVHNAEIPWTGEEAYNKNLRVQMGRCPVRSIFPEALAAMARNQHLLSFMFDKIMPLSEAAKAYDLFDKMQAHKIVLVP